MNFPNALIRLTVEALLFLLSLTQTGNTVNEIQKIIAFEGAFEVLLGERFSNAKLFSLPTPTTLNYHYFFQISFTARVVLMAVSLFKMHYN